MRLLDLMEPEILTISANDYAIEARRLMEQQHTNWILVLEKSQIAGVVLAQELASLPEGMLKERDVREYIRPNLLTINCEAQPREAERMLNRSGRNFLVVVQDNHPIGVITQESLVHGSRRQKQVS